jgi:hypothetical protein
MAADITSIFNLALSACNHRSSVAIYTEDSREARLCRTWYDHTRQLVLSAAPWDSATKQSRLAVLAERDDSLDWASADPQTSWLFAYGAPVDMVRPRNLSTFARFKPGPWDNQNAILANESTAILTYTYDNRNPALWEIGLRDAIAFSLAAIIVGPLTGSDNRQNLLINTAFDKVMQARANIANSDSGQLPEAIPDWIAARGFTLSSPQTPYIYPPADFGTASFSLAK